MSIFGKLDAATIPTNPFHIEKGEYLAEITKAEFKTNRDNQRQLFIEYTITDTDSQYVDSKASQFFTLVDADMTAEMFELLPAEEKKNIRRANATLKRTLCGHSNNAAQKGLGVNPDDLNDENWNPAVLLGTKVMMAINNGTTGEYVNVRWANIISE